MESLDNAQYLEGFKRNPGASVGGIVLSLVLIFLPLFVLLRDEPDEREEARAQAVAYQVVEIRRKTLQNNNREPASTPMVFQNSGRLGKDLEGRPFFYQLDEQSSDLVVKVWTEARPEHATEVRIRKDMSSF